MNVLSFEFGGLLLAAIVAALPGVRPADRDWPALPLAFVAALAAGLLFGPLAGTLVLAAAVGTEALTKHRRGARWPRLIVDGIGVAAAFAAAVWTHRALGGSVGTFAWPWQAAPIAASVVAYCAVLGIWTDVLSPLLGKRSVNRAWPARLARECPPYIIGASAAAALAQALLAQAWDVLAVAAVPGVLAYRLYCSHVARLEQGRQRNDLIASLADGLCIVDAQRRVTLWNDALERLLDAPRVRALGHTLFDAVPALGGTELAQALDETLTEGTPRTLPRLLIRGSQGVRVLQVKLVPLSDVVTLLWQDVTEHARAVQSLTRQGERLGLAAEVANDGLWEWDLRTQQFYVTGRWKAMLGLPATASIGRVEDWFERVHADDIAGLRRAVEGHLANMTASGPIQHEHRIRHEDGSYRSFQCRGVTKRQNGRAVRIAGSLTDTTDLATTQERLRNAVFLDPLTGLCNRAVFVEGLGRRLRDCQQRRVADRFALLYLDLDRFKVVNDSLGHLVGDELLVAVSRRLESCLRDGDVLARLGGDEFAILLNGLQTEQQANVVAFRVQEALSRPFLIAGREVFTSASIGIAFGSAQYGTPDEMMHDADTAMYQAKANGKARHEVFDADMDARARDRLGLESDLRRAVSAGDFALHYQPIVSLGTGMCVGFESLVRWTRNGKPVSPAMFIPLAEELGLIEALGTQVLEEACRTFAGWRRRFPELDCITVNVSTRQLMQQNFLSVVERAVQQSRLHPSALRIEITETALMTSPDSAAKVLSDLRDFGVKIYLDDFGTGYSSLSHLARLPVDALKIDRTFVRSLLLPDRPAIVESILALARTLNTGVVAEGIETEVQARELERLGCTHAQGFLFSRPLSTEAAEQVLLARRPLGPKGALVPVAVAS